MMRTLNKNIRNFRNFRGMTQEDLATKIGKSKNVVSNWERGDNAPDVDTIELICKALSVTPNQLFGWEPHKDYEKYTKHMERKKMELDALESERRAIQEKIDTLQYELKMEEERLKGE